MSREFELKYRAEEPQLDRIREAFPGGRLIRMETTYYDMPNRMLSRQHWTLRRRMENEASVCTLKVPLPDGSKDEWEVTAPDIYAGVPKLVEAGAPRRILVLDQETLVPICGARFTRYAVNVPCGDAMVELALDQGVLLGGGKEIPLCEAEAELKSGSDEAAIAFAAELAEQYGLVPEKKSKFKRAKDLADSE